MNRVLVIEDHADTREVVCQLLADMGYVVAGVESAERGLEELRTGAYDVLVLDYWLDGGHTGAWLIKESRSEGCAVPVVMCTAERLLPDVPDDVSILTKPIDIGQLVDHVERLVHAPSPSRRPPRAEQLAVELVLYITSSPASIRCLRNLRRFLNRLPPERFSLEVIDISRTPDETAKIAFTPMLVKRAPGVEERLIGDFRDTAALEDMFGRPEAVVR